MEYKMNNIFNLISIEQINKIIEQSKTFNEDLTPLFFDNIQLAKYIDHTLLKPDATENNIHNLCNEAIEYGFYSVCVNPIWVDYCFNLLKSTDVKVCSVIGFPLGASRTDVKITEAQKAISDGAEELDMVINIGKLKSAEYNFVFDEISRLAELTKKFNAKLKVIIETCLLTDEEKVIASFLSKEAKADFVKTSTGFSTAGANLFDVSLMKLAADGLEIKASGGIKSRSDALNYIKYGVTRLGTSSGVKIIKDQSSNSEY